MLSFLFTKTALAGGFNLKSIGQVDTSGQEISHWWYSGLTPSMTGEAVVSSVVTISIDGTETTTTTDESGNWAYNPGTLTSGDHQIVLTNSGSTINFTLTLGAENVNYTAISSGSTEALPTAGVIFPTVILLGVAGVLFLTAKKIAQQN